MGSIMSTAKSKYYDKTPITLLSLPDELLMAIFQHLAPDPQERPNRTAKAALCSASLSCKRLYSISQPALYKNISIKTAQCLVRLSRTLADNDQVRAWVHYVKFFPSNEFYWLDASLPPWDKNEFNRVQRRLSELVDFLKFEPLPVGDYWSTHSLSHDFQILSGLLALAPRIRTLDLQLVYGPSQFLFNFERFYTDHQRFPHHVTYDSILSFVHGLCKGIDKEPQESRFLASLEEIRLHATMTAMHETTPVILSPLLRRRPGISRLQTVNDDGEWPRLLLDMTAQQRSHLSEVQATEVASIGYTGKNIVKAFPALRRLTLEGNHEHQQDLEPLDKALPQLADSLQYLRMRLISTWYAPCVGDLSKPNFLQNLPQLRSLRHLDIEVAVLCNNPFPEAGSHRGDNKSRLALLPIADMLPTLLEKLELTESPWMRSASCISRSFLDAEKSGIREWLPREYYDALCVLFCRLAEECPVKLPRLRLVRIIMRDLTHKEMCQQLEQMGMMGDSTNMFVYHTGGVSFELIRGLE